MFPRHKIDANMITKIEAGRSGLLLQEEGPDEVCRRGPGCDGNATRASEGSQDLDLGQAHLCPQRLPKEARGESSSLFQCLFRHYCDTRSPRSKVGQQSAPSLEGSSSVDSLYSHDGKKWSHVPLPKCKIMHCRFRCQRVSVPVCACIHA